VLFHTFRQGGLTVHFVFFMVERNPGTEKELMKNGPVRFVPKLSYLGPEFGALEKNIREVVPVSRSEHETSRKEYHDPRSGEIVGNPCSLFL
jgi:hypothetical protein